MDFNTFDQIDLAPQIREILRIAVVLQGRVPLWQRALRVIGGERKERLQQFSSIRKIHNGQVYPDGSMRRRKLTILIWQTYFYQIIQYRSSRQRLDL